MAVLLEYAYDLNNSSATERSLFATSRFSPAFERNDLKTRQNILLSDFLLPLYSFFWIKESLNKHNKKYEEKYDEIIFLEIPFYRIIYENVYVLNTLLKIISQNAFKSFVKYLIYYFHS